MMLSEDKIRNKDIANLEGTVSVPVNRVTAQFKLANLTPSIPYGAALFNSNVDGVISLDSFNIQHPENIATLRNCARNCGLLNIAASRYCHQPIEGFND